MTVTVVRPELTPEEREKRMQEIRKAVAAVCAATKKEAASRS